MSETSEHPAFGARFPYAAVAFCVACIAAAVWTFMLHSYAWSMTPRDLLSAERRDRGMAVRGKYVELRGVRGRGFWTSTHWSGWRVPVEEPPGADPSASVPAGRQRAWARVAAPTDVHADAGRALAVKGRLIVTEDVTSGARMMLHVDGTASRWTGATVAGLVVAAMGVAVFAVYLRQWLIERRLAADAGTAFTAEIAEDAEGGEGG